jgi:hypothetical protein
VVANSRFMVFPLPFLRIYGMGENCAANIENVPLGKTCWATILRNGASAQFARFLAA